MNTPFPEAFSAKPMSGWESKIRQTLNYFMYSNNGTIKIQYQGYLQEGVS